MPLVTTRPTNPPRESLATTAATHMTPVAQHRRRPDQLFTTDVVIRVKGRIMHIDRAKSFSSAWKYPVPVPPCWIPQAA